MGSDSRFPNRKRRAEEPPSLGFNIPESELEKPLDKPAEAELQNPSGERSAAEPMRLSGYRVIEPPPQTLPPITPEASPQIPADVNPAAEAQQTTTAPPIPPPPAAGAPPTPRLPLSVVLIQRIRKFAESPTRVYAAAGVGLGVLIGVIAAAFWISENPDGRYDLGSVTSSAAGLKGHLFIQWDKKLEYRLSIEPTEAAQQQGFAFAVASSPRPLSITIHLQDNQGFALCDKDILLKYDPRNAPSLAASNPDTPPAKTDADNAARAEPQQELDFTQLDAQETAREQGKDIFTNQMGPNGQIAAINAQGTIPCTARAYANTSSWSIAPDFPSIAEQDALLKHQQQVQSGAERPSAEELAARKKMAAKAAVKVSGFSVEGDDSIVEYDADRGIIETSAGKVFFFDRTGGDTSNPRWEDYPVSIHYRCDQSSSCILIHSGIGALRTRLRK
ncbi:MAG: hypothetical protein ABSE51_11505 [Terracidiphilus sp.]|jgi:hypothetical protein